MNERTVIGGVSYETVGSSTSNLLIRCNGTARIQWGSRLIDLVKNGKLATPDAKEFIFVIQNESQINDDGIYIMEQDETTKILLYKNNQKYDLSRTDLYISATDKQNITAEQQKQALENLGICFNSLEDVQTAGINQGFVYVLNKKALYLIKDGSAYELSTKQTTASVEDHEQIENENFVNSSDYQISTDISFPRGTIVMFNNVEAVPSGWVVCDGQVHDGISITPPDLTSMFITKIVTLDETDSEASGLQYPDCSVIYIMKL